MPGTTPKTPKTPEEKKARNAKIRYYAFDLFMPAVAGLFLILAIFWPGTVFSCFAGVSVGIVLIRFATTRYQGQGRTAAERIALAGGVVLILLAAARLAVLLLMETGVLPR